MGRRVCISRQPPPYGHQKFSIQQIRVLGGGAAETDNAVTAGWRAEGEVAARRAQAVVGAAEAPTTNHLVGACFRSDRIQDKVKCCNNQLDTSRSPIPTRYPPYPAHRMGLPPAGSCPPQSCRPHNRRHPLLPFTSSQVGLASPHGYALRLAPCAAFSHSASVGRRLPIQLQ